jgi:sugar lactone lactonase YvrE
LTFGEDGMLYVLEDDEGAILRVDPSSGQLSVFITDDELAEQTAIAAIDLGNHIVGGPGRTLYLVSHGEPAAILAVEPGMRARVVTDSPELGEAEGFLTLDREGNLVLMNKERGVVQRIRPDGTLTVLLSVERLAAIFGDEVRLAGGAAFDAAGHFFLTEDDTESIARLDAAMQGGIWIDEPTVRAVTGSDPDYESSIAFSPVRR